MRLFLIRHAAAEERRRGLPDAARALTPRGRQRFERCAAGLARLGVAFDRVHHSGRRRAAETADLLAPLTKSAATVSIHLARAPAAPLLAELAGEHVALVGHEPWLGELAAWLVTGSRSRGARFALKKGGVIVLDGAPRPGAMRVVAALPPKVLRSIARR